MQSYKTKPIVLVIAGHDPSGGAGIQADIESITSAGCYAASVISTLTVQNSGKVTSIQSVSSEIISKQIKLLTEDMTFAACKIGLLTDSASIEIISKEISKLDIPVVVDPIIKSGSGSLLVNDEICESIISKLLPLTTVLTPNSIELRSLSGENNLDDAAHILLNKGAKHVFATGTHENTEQVINTLYSAEKAKMEYFWPRLKGEYHGSGCTLSANIAARLALGHDIGRAIKESQQYTWDSLNAGLKLGKHQLFPNRIHK